MSSSSALRCIHLDHRSLIEPLIRRALLAPELATRLRQAVGFRYVLVYEPVRVDDDVVRARLADPGDVADFVAAVISWAAGH